MTVLIFFHVLAMFIAFALTTGTGIFMAQTLETDDVNVVRSATRVNRRLSMIGGISLFIGLILGFAIAGQAGFSMTSTWLIVTYVCVVILLALAFGVLNPFIARLSAAAEASVPQASPELKALLASPTPRVAGPLAGLMWITIIAMMVLKP
ncbi:MAG TPA: DUF2269 family protein [Candidatus Eremiobacteraceae bacterium]|nr:DUF2269 family protein [Candidatus Eremiobacteraceae bacterium]